MKIITLLLLVISLVGCSNADVASVRAWGKVHDVKCYSGGILIYHGYTTGKVENESNSDGYYFQDDETRKFVRVSGNCVITVDGK